jgi:hypothetical protein
VKRGVNHLKRCCPLLFFAKQQKVNLPGSIKAATSCQSPSPEEVLFTAWSVMCSQLSNVTRNRGSINNNRDTRCDQCKALEANDYEKIAYFVSLLDQQDKMWMQGKSAEAKELEDAISRARQAVVQARTYLVMHGASHRQPSCTSLTYCPDINVQRRIRSIYG